MNTDNNQIDIQSITQEAIREALNKHWDKAIELNQAILQEIPDDIPSLNRLGIAYSMIGKPTKALAAFKNVLQIDSHNQIAINNISRQKANRGTSPLTGSLQTTSFIEEPGKSKIIPLVSPGEPNVFSSLSIGEEVLLTFCKYKVKVCSHSNKFIGYLPDNISLRLIKLSKSGYKYKANMKSVSNKTPQVFIQETHISKKMNGVPSFPLDMNEQLPSLSSGESSGSPKLEIYDPMMSNDDF